MAPPPAVRWQAHQARFGQDHPAEGKSRRLQSQSTVELRAWLGESTPPVVSSAVPAANAAAVACVGLGEAALPVVSLAPQLLLLVASTMPVRKQRPRHSKRYFPQPTLKHGRHQLDPLETKTLHQAVPVTSQQAVRVAKFACCYSTWTAMAARSLMIPGWASA